MRTHKSARRAVESTVESASADVPLINMNATLGTVPVSSAPLVERVSRRNQTRRALARARTAAALAVERVERACVCARTHVVTGCGNG